MIIVECSRLPKFRKFSPNNESGINDKLVARGAKHAPPTAPISVAAGVGTAHGHDTDCALVLAYSALVLAIPR